MHLARAFLADRSGGAERGAADPHQIFVHLDQDVLGEGGAYAATLDDGTRLPAETLRRLACDAGLVATRTDGAGAVLDIGRRTRSIPPALRRALWLRDRGCRFPGCSHRRFLHGHHVRHWLGGGSTSLANLVLLCSRHHRLVHEGRFTIERAQPQDVLAFRAPRGHLLPAVPPPETIENAVASLHDWASERGLEIGPRARAREPLPNTNTNTLSSTSSSTSTRAPTGHEHEHGHALEHELEHEHEHEHVRSRRGVGGGRTPVAVGPGDHACR